MNTDILQRLDPSVIDDLRARLAPFAARRQLSRVAKVGGLTYSWVHDFASGEFKNPGVVSLHKLATALAAVETEDAA